MQNNEITKNEAKGRFEEDRAAGRRTATYEVDGVRIVQVAKIHGEWAAQWFTGKGPEFGWVCGTSGFAQSKTYPSRAAAIDGGFAEYNAARKPASKVTTTTKDVEETTDLMRLLEASIDAEIKSDAKPAATILEIPEAVEAPEIQQGALELAAKSIGYMCAVFAGSLIFPFDGDERRDWRIAGVKGNTLTIASPKFGEREIENPDRVIVI